MRAAEPLSQLYATFASDSDIPFGGRSPLLLCARAMRQMVAERMRRAETQTDRPVLEIDAALESVERINTRLARVIECRYFARMSEDETARALNVDLAAVSRDWRRGRAWLLRTLTPDGAPAPPAVANATWVDAVFDDALALPVDGVDGFLARCAAAPGGLRGYVEELLQLAADSSGRVSPDDLPEELLWSILTDGEVGRPVEQVLPPEAAVAESGGWRIVRELRGGPLGPLYLAERSPAGGEQKGALRFVPPSVATDLFTLRSRPDYRALASLRHEGIARLLDSGETDDGRLFIVSENVEGRPIDQHCDDALLTIDERLELFSKVCGAVQHAHRKLVVHGAIQPSNVVVTGVDQVKLLDFGSVDLVTPAGEREDGSTIGPLPSLAFASPEQVHGEHLAVASDVYQLGLLLYLLLTGEHAQTVSRPGRAAFEHAVCASAPILPSARAAAAPEKNAAARRHRPRSLVRVLRGDLDAILMYALRKEPERRYPSVSLLRSDIERYQKCLPVWAQSDTPWYRVRKFAQRRRASVAAALLFVMLGAAMLPGRLDRASASLDNARKAEAERVLARMFAPAARAGAEMPNALQFVEEAVTIARTELSPGSQSQAHLFTVIGRAYASLGHYHRSIDILEEALALHRGHFGADSVAVAGALQALGESRLHLGRYDEAETNLRTALAVRTVREGSRTPGALAVSTGLAEVLHARGQFDSAERILRETIAVLRPELIESADDAPVHELLPQALRGLANVLRDRGAAGESEALYREAIAMLRQRGRAPATQVAATQVDLARLLIIRSELERAEFELSQAISTFDREHVVSHPALATARRDQAFLRMEQGRLDDAQRLLGEAERLQEQLVGRVGPTTPRTRALQAELARRRGDVPQAVVVATEALEQLGRLNMPDHPCTVDIRTTLAQSLMVLGEFQQATRVLGQALTVAERAFVTYDPRIARLQHALQRAAGTRTAGPSDAGITGSAP